MGHAYSASIQVGQPASVRAMSYPSLLCLKQTILCIFPHEKLIWQSKLLSWTTSLVCSTMSLEKYINSIKLNSPLTKVPLFIYYVFPARITSVKKVRNS
jgi:hypothetical protein